MKKLIAGAALAAAMATGAVGLAPYAHAEDPPAHGEGCSYGGFVRDVAELDGPMGEIYKPGLASHGAVGYCAGFLPT